MRVVLASAIIALAGYSAARPLTVGDIAESTKSGGDSISSGIRGSSSAGSDGLDLNALGGASSSSSSSSLPEVEDDDPLLSSLNDNFPSDSDFLEEEAGSSSAGINSGSGIGSSELEMKFGHLNAPASSSSSSAEFDPTSPDFDPEDEEDDDFSSSSSPSSDLDVGNGLTMPRTDGFSDMSEDELRDFVRYLALMLKDTSELDADDAEGFESSLDDESDFPAPISSGFGDEPDWVSAGGEGESEMEEELPGDEAADLDLNGPQFNPDQESSPFPNGRQLSPTEQAEVNAL